MKLVSLKNITGKRLVFPDVRDFDFDVDEVRKVLPAMLAHPSIARRLGSALLQENDTGVVPPVPQQPSSPPTTAKPKSVEPVAVDVVPEAESEPEGEVAGQSILREEYLAGPGITETNVDAILELFPSMRDLAQADRNDLLELGVAKSFVKKLQQWAAV